uniref:Uncharacterized protein n=1 Tax=Anguilla anguilla TaxID=7936 RepID=A0A0E9W776_ANGAN
MFMQTHMTDHSLTIMSLLGIQETRNRPGLQGIKVRGEKLSYGVRRTSGELGRCLENDVSSAISKQMA